MSREIFQLKSKNLLDVLSVIQVKGKISRASAIGAAALVLSETIVKSGLIPC